MQSDAAKVIRLWRVVRRFDMEGRKVNQFVVISGCSGGGKSSLLAELARRGWRVFEEPGRQVVKAQLASGGDALPWADAREFALACVALGLEQFAEAARVGGRAFFDRSVLDACNALERMKVPLTSAYADVLTRQRYHRRVFMTPPWPEIYAEDAERRHSFDAAVGEFETLPTFYERHGYEVVLLPTTTIGARADFVLAHLSGG